MKYFFSFFLDNSSNLDNELSQLFSQCISLEGNDVFVVSLIIKKSKMLHLLWALSKLMVLIVSYLSFVSYSLLLNDIIFGNIIPQKGIWQGDLIFHYLLIIRDETLTRLLHVENSSNLHWIKISKNAPATSHLIYVDDLILLCCANLTDTNVIQ